MTTVSQPSVTIAIANADSEVQNTAQKVLLVGQKLGAGSATAGALTEDVRIEQIDGLFGEASMLAAMARAFRKVNQVVQVDAIALDDAGAATQRVVTLTLSAGPVTVAGTIMVIAGSEVNHKFVVAANVGDTQDNVRDAIVAAVNADTKCPFTATTGAGTVVLTADNGGVVANDLGVEVINTDVVGVTVTGVAETTPGATDPTLTGILDVATSRYQTIVWPYSDFTVLQAFLGPRLNADNAVLDGVGVVTLQDTFANLDAVLLAENDENLVVFCDEQTTETLFLGPAQNEVSYVKSSIFAGIRSIRLTDGQPIGRFLTSGASLDQFGGPALATLPYFNTPLDDLPLIKTGRGWTRQEIEDLLDSGGSVMGQNVAGNTAILGEVVTTYKTDAAGNPDVSFKFLNYVDTASGAREFMFNNLRARFAQSRLTEGAVSRGRDMVNEPVFNSYLDRLYSILAGPTYVLVQDGEAALVFFKDNRTVALDLSIGRITATMKVPIVTQLREVIATLKIAFSTQS